MYLWNCWQFISNSITSIILIIEMDIVKDLCAVADLTVVTNKHGFYPCYRFLRYLQLYWDIAEILEVAEVLISMQTIAQSWKQIDQHKPLLHCAVSLEKLNFTRMLLKKGVDVNLKSVLDETPLHIACKKPEIPEDVFLALITSKTLNAVDNGELTALYWTCWREHHNLTTILLKQNADVNFTTHNG